MPYQSISHSGVEDAVAAIAAGRCVVVLDDADRENEADLIMAADRTTTEDVAFFLSHTSGFLCVALDSGRVDALKLPPMVAENTEALSTAFTVSVDLRHGTTTGISAGDRATTCRALADPTTVPADLTRPGHVMPLRARAEGVLARRGHTEAGVDLCRLAGVEPGALICELVTPDRRGMLRGSAAVDFAHRHDLPVITIGALADHRASGAVERSAQAPIPVGDAEFTAVAYRDRSTSVEHVAIVLGDVGSGEPVLCRVHSECLTGDIFGSRRCDCGRQLRAAESRIVAEGRGILIYLRGHEGRGIGLGGKLRAYQLQQDIGLDTVDANTALGLPADARDYTAAAAILADLGATEVVLLTNNPAKQTALRRHGIRVTRRDPIEVDPTPENLRYLVAKRDRMGHHLNLEPTVGERQAASEVAS